MKILGKRGTHERQVRARLNAATIPRVAAHVEYQRAVSEKTWTRWEILAVLLAIVIACALYLAWLDVPILYDAAGYLQAAKDIRINGLFSKYELSDLRTYGWPLLLSWLVRISEWTGAPLRAVAFGFELLFHLFACYLFRRALLRTVVPTSLAKLLAASLLLNPLVLIFTTYLLTESVSFSLLIMLLANSAYLAAATGPRKLWPALTLGSLVLGAAIMVRPANVCMIPVWWGTAATGLWKAKPGLAKGLCATVLTLLLTFVPTIPQYLNNVKYYQRPTPLLANNFSMAGVWLGVRLIKYGGCYITGTNPQVMYENPFLGNEPLDPLAPLTWYTNHPGKGIATLGLHLFNLLDQDQPFPYPTSLLPSYYPSAALANMLMVSLGFIGLIFAGWHVYRRRRDALPLYCVAIATLACQVGVQAFYSVEARYGIPMLMVLYMFASWLLAYEFPKPNVRKRVVLLVFAGTTTAASYPLSRWVRQQAPLIRAASQVRNDSAEVPRILEAMDPTGKFVSGELDNWTAGEAGIGPDGEAILCARKPGAVSFFSHPVTLEKSTDYFVEFEARAPAGMTSKLSVDLYGGDAYDQAEQKSLFVTLSKEYERYKAGWNSGSNAPSNALLRFGTTSKTPIQIRHVVFYKSTRH